MGQEALEYMMPIFIRKDSNLIGPGGSPGQLYFSEAPDGSNVQPGLRSRCKKKSNSKRNSEKN